MKLKEIKTKHVLLGSFGFLAIGLIGGYVAGTRQYKNVITQYHSIREADNPYTFIAPLIGFSAPSAPSTGQFKSLDKKIRDIFTQAPQKEVVRYAVYFRDLYNGLWVGINEDDKYDPASMLKVVAAIAAYKEIENNPQFENTRLVYSRAFANLDASFPDGMGSSLAIDQSYSVSELIRKMITDSDNGAKDLLLYSINNKILEEVYTDLNIPKPGTDSSTYTISTREYSRFFRILYNATYLTREHSEALLNSLNRATFTKGLVAGVPATIKVAHKFGERVIKKTPTTEEHIELHDCGVIYQSTRPYFLCVMTEGVNEDSLASLIAQVSQTAFEEVQNTYK